MRKIFQILFCTLLLIGTFLTPLKASANNIVFDNFVADQAGILSSTTKDSINEHAIDLQRRTGADIAVVTLKKQNVTKPLSDITREIGRKYKIGSKDKNEGVILAIVPDGKSGNRMRIEVGYGLEGVLNDGKCGRILDDYVVPYYEQRQYEKAVEQGFSAIYNELNKYYDNPGEYKKKIQSQNSDESSFDFDFWFGFVGMVLFVIFASIVQFIVIVTKPLTRLLKKECTFEEFQKEVDIALAEALRNSGSAGSSSDRSSSRSSSSDFGGGGGFGGGGASR